MSDFLSLRLSIDRGKSFELINVRPYMNIFELSSTVNNSEMLQQGNRFYWLNFPSSLSLKISCFIHILA